jgi:hypothetical protein
MGSFEGVRSAGFLGLFSKVNVGVHASGTAGDVLGSRATANARWDDTIRWLNPELFPGPGVVRFVFSPSVRGSRNGPISESDVRVAVGAHEAGRHDSGTGTFSETYRFAEPGLDLAALGSTVLLDIAVTGGADPHGESSSVNFLHTLWLPAIEMVDENGNRVPGSENAILMGDSGIQYAMWSPNLTYPADFDEDVDVDADDLALWSVGLGRLADASHVEGDADENHAVDGADFLVWQRQAGSVGPPIRSVPEPSATALTALALIGLSRANLNQVRRERPGQGS